MAWSGDACGGLDIRIAKILGLDPHERCVDELRGMVEDLMAVEYGRGYTNGHLDGSEEGYSRGFNNGWLAEQCSEGAWG